MKAMILAAGKGTRMRPLTYELPKPMIPILGKPVMEYIVDSLARHGITKIMVNVSHLPQRIESYFGDGHRWGVEIGYSFEGYIENNEIVAAPLGSAGGMKRIQNFAGFFDDTFLVVCGDAIIDIDLQYVLREHWKKHASASVLVHQIDRERLHNYGVVVADDNGQISHFQEKPAPNEALSDLVNTGIYIFEPEIFDLIPDETIFDIGSDLFPAILEKNLPFYAIQHPFHWFDIGRLNDYWEINQQMMRGLLRGADIPGKEIQPGLWTGLNVDIDIDSVRIEGPVYIGANSCVEPHCEIMGPTWIGPGCHVQRGARITRSILFEHTLIESFGEVREAVLFGKQCVDKHGNSIQNGSTLNVRDAREIKSNWKTSTTSSRHYPAAMDT